jgi:DNA-binding beta-propeller fold protein YncE
VEVLQKSGPAMEKILASSKSAGAEAIAFDGLTVWITNSDSNSVTKLTASDGSTLGTFPVGLTPSGIVFDGQSMWITNYRSSTIMKMRVSDGTVLGTFPTGSEPLVPAFDGAIIWIPNSEGNSVSKM